MGGNNTKPTKERTLEFLNSITSESYMEVSMKCSTSVSPNQSIELECHTDTVQENSPACLSCISLVKAQLDSQFEIVDTEPSSIKNLDINEQFSNAAEQVKSCSQICKSCYFSDISQMAFVQVKSDCQFDNQVIADWKTSVTNKLLSTLYSRQDIGSALMKALGSSNKDETFLKVTNRVTTKMTSSLFQTLNSQIDTRQSILVNSGSASSFSGIHQSIVATQISEYLGRSKTFSDVMSDAESEAVVKNWQEDTTIGPIGDALVKTVSSFEKIISSTVGAILFTLLVLLGFALVAIILYLVFYVFGGSVSKKN